MIKELRQVVSSYKNNGFAPFPLSAGSKIPPKGCRLETADTKCPYQKDSNIGLFSGSKNNLAVIDADSDATKVEVLNKLRGLGLLEWTTIVSTPNKNGYHFWIKVTDVPNNAQAYYNLANYVGDGEFRVRRPSYIVAPPSVVDAGLYKFVQGGVEFFNQQPEIKWIDMGWLIPLKTLMNGNGNHRGSSVPKKFNNFRRFNSNPPILGLLSELGKIERGDRIHRIDFKTGQKIKTVYPSRSEAEFSTVLSLAFSGWDYDRISKAFEYYKPKHYMETPNRESYLIRTWNKVVDIMNR